MATLQVASPPAWLEARMSLLEKEKELTRAKDNLAAARRELPIVPITKDYIFKDATGAKTFADLFEGRTQLFLYHFMFGPEYEQGCRSCSSFADSLPHLSHLHSRDTTFCAVSRAPIEKIEEFKKRMGWTFPWYSSSESDFNFDFHVSMDESRAPVEYNYTGKEELVKKGLEYATKGEHPGISCFLLGDGEGETKKGQVYHTYSTYSRGLEHALGTYNLLDLTKLGRQEEKMEGAGVRYFLWHDMYEQHAQEVKEGKECECVK